MKIEKQKNSDYTMVHWNDGSTSAVRKDILEIIEKAYKNGKEDADKSGS